MEYISYAAGLTSMSFRFFFLITTFASIPATVITVYLLDRSLTLNPIYIALFTASNYISLLLFIHIGWRRKRALSKVITA
jgi:uncharacterized membrane protein YdjX (TVP38/TMEM64 family)